VSCPPNKQSNAVLHISRKCCRCSRANPIKTRVVRVPRLRSVSVPVCQKQSTTFKQRLGQHTECMQAYQQDHAPSHTSNMKSYTRTHNTHMGHAWTLLRIKRRRGSRDSGIQISLAQTATYAPGATSMHEVRLHPHWAHETHNVCKEHARHSALQLMQPAVCVHGGSEIQTRCCGFSWHLYDDSKQI
jgi:hypothetical protein